jgi:RNA polymerase sigma factor (sigma-70 family)
LTTSAADTTTPCLQQDPSRFLSLFEPKRRVLEGYCRSITGSPWEADDLLQETSLKAYSMFKRNPFQQELPKAYLFRIASNAWIDRCRRSRSTSDIHEAGHGLAADAPVDFFEIKDAVERLVSLLPERQRVLVMLVDVFQFTVSETAVLLGTTEGAVKAGLHRARTKLKANRDSGEPDSNEYGGVDEAVVYAYLEAFQNRNPHALVMLLNGEASMVRPGPVVQARAEAPGDRRNTSPGQSYRGKRGSFGTVQDGWGRMAA